MNQSLHAGKATLGQLTRVLLAQGLVTADEIHVHGIRSRDASRSHRVAIVEVGRYGADGYRAYVVKQLLPNEDRRQGSPAQERDVYRLAADDESLARLVPRVHHADPDSGFLVLEYLPELESVAERAARNRWSDGLLAASFGEAIGDWHRHAVRSVARAPVAEVPWVFGAFGTDRPEFLTSNPPVADFIAMMDATPGPSLDSWLATAADLWRPSTVIHGDLRFDNALVDAHGQIVLIDWEFGGYGDPAWDIAAALQEMLSASSAVDAASAMPVLSGVGLVLLSAYAARTGLLDEHDDFRDRLLVYTAARLVLRALQLAQQEHQYPSDDPDPTEPTERDRHLALALALRASPELFDAVWRTVAA